MLDEQNTLRVSQNDGVLSADEDEESRNEWGQSAASFSQLFGETDRYGCADNLRVLSKTREKLFGIDADAQLAGIARFSDEITAPERLRR